MTNYENENENKEQAIIPATAIETEEKKSDFQGQLQQYQQQATEVVNKAKTYANEYIGQASEKLKEYQNKDLNKITDDAKDFARRKPGQAIAISAVVGLALGLLVRGGRR